MKPWLELPGRRRNSFTYRQRSLQLTTRDWGAGLLGDKANSMTFDNSKLKRAVPDYVATIPFARGAEEIMAWFDADPARQSVDQNLDRLMDTLIAAQRSALP